MSLKIRLFLFFILFFSISVYAQKSFTLNGYVTDAASGEGLIGVPVYSKLTGRGSTTNAYGFYSLTLPTDTGTINVDFIGYEGQIIKYTKNDIENQLNFELIEKSNLISEVQVVGHNEQREILTSTDGSVVKVPMQQIKLIPSVLGESDIIKALQLMPGITTGGEVNANFFVRGGEADQNLVILDEAVVYNSGHLLGFYSVFNSDVIKDVKLYKGGFPACYGGRLSSVMDVRMKEGNINEFHGTGSVGILSTKVTVEGQIVKDKLSFILSGRRTYVDKVYGMLGVEIPYYFYDLNAKVNWKIGKKDHLYFSAYLGNDVLYMPEFEQDSTDMDSAMVDTTQMVIDPKFGFTLGNKTVTLRWNHQVSSKIFCNTSLIYNDFKYDLNAEDGVNLLMLRSSLQDFTVKTDFDYNLNSWNQVQFGGLATQHKFHPNMVFAEGELLEGRIDEQEALNLQTSEFAGYLLDEIELFKKVKINAGIRYTYVLNGETHYDGLEPRLLVNWMIDEKRSFKFGYSKMKQYLHRVSSSNFIMPTDMYYPVTELIKPQQADQYFASYTRNFPKEGIMLTLEFYQKEMENLIEFKEGTKLFLNNDFEKDMLAGTGNSYGAEVFLQKTQGNVTGWISYTYSVSNRYFEGLNEGVAFPSKNDRRHNFSVVAIFKLSEKVDLSTSWIYMTGARITPVMNLMLQPNAAQTGFEAVQIFGTRNGVEMSEIHRLDFSITFKPWIGKNKKFKSEWQIGMYNVYNRATPFRVDIVWDERGFYKYQEPGLFGRIVNVSYNFTF